MIDPIAIAEDLKKNRSKERVAHWVTQMAKEHFVVDDFVAAIKTLPHPSNWYLSWVMSHYFSSFPHLGAKGQLNLWELLKTTQHPSVQRDLWKTLSVLNIDEEISGYVYDHAIRIIPSPIYAIAARAHAIQAAFNIAKPYPELRHELALLLRSIPEAESSGIKARAKNMLLELKKLPT
ncbi:MAG: hypothetical protein WEC59_02060 [Salibacteraceae bacterium]